MNDAVSLLGFYLAMVALLASIFFARLETWYSEVQVLARLWKEFPRRNPDPHDLASLRQQALSLQSSFPLLGFLLVGSFLILISLFGALLGGQVTWSTVAPWYIYLPGALFEVIFFGGAIFLLTQGKNKVDTALTEIDALRG